MVHPDGTQRTECDVSAAVPRHEIPDHLVNSAQGSLWTIRPCDAKNESVSRGQSGSGPKRCVRTRLFISDLGGIVWVARMAPNSYSSKLVPKTTIGGASSGFSSWDHPPHYKSSINLISLAKLKS
eukprot:m.47392 g.47392  ORF g.47392 m.47392 type:complete len:125 (-) comp8851_c0_seq1:21-395(-)